MVYFLFLLCFFINLRHGIYRTGNLHHNEFITIETSWLHNAAHIHISHTKKLYGTKSWHEKVKKDPFCYNTTI